jgi:hypothetical protein
LKKALQKLGLDIVQLESTEKYTYGQDVTVIEKSGTLRYIIFIY